MAADRQFSVASWNIQGATKRNALSGDGLADVVNALATHGTAPDIVLLQEVPRVDAGSARLRDEFARVGLQFIEIGEHGPVEHERGAKHYTNLIASRWRLTRWAWSDANPAPWPELLLATEVDWPGLRFLAINAHIPNGSNNGWWKINTFQALARALEASDLPVVLGGDFNEPKQFVETGLISWGVSRAGTFVGDLERKKGSRGPRPRQEWQSAVTSVLLHEATRRWRGVHAATQSSGGLPETTHISSGAHRSYDHVLTDPAILPATLRYVHDVREGDSPLSDHSLLVATISPNTATRPS